LSDSFFAKLNGRRLKRPGFRSTIDLQPAINRFITDADDPVPFVCTRSDDIKSSSPSITTAK
jgi:hypothetical protein